MPLNGEATVEESAERDSAASNGGEGNVRKKKEDRMSEISCDRMESSAGSVDLKTTHHELRIDPSEMQNEMKARISREALEAAFDARFPETIRTKLRGARVAVAGLGGLGSSIALMLARSGVGKLLLVDFDVVDVTNLNRQMYFIRHLGWPKTEALTELVYEIDPYAEVESRCVRVTPENVHALFAEYPIVCEAFDQPDQKAMLVRELLTQCPETTVVSGNGMAGYADANAICTTQMMRRLYVCGDQETEVGDGSGLMAPRVTVCAAHQANKVIQLILQ